MIQVVYGLINFEKTTKTVTIKVSNPGKLVGTNVYTINVEIGEEKVDTTTTAPAAKDDDKDSKDKTDDKTD